MGARCPEGCFTDPSNTRLEETRWGYRRIEASFEGCQDPEWAATPYMDGRMDRQELAKSRVTPYGLDTQSAY